jgi:hypothetical protein
VHEPHEAIKHLVENHPEVISQNMEEPEVTEMTSKVDEVTEIEAVELKVVSSDSFHQQSHQK